MARHAGIASVIAGIVVASTAATSRASCNVIPSTARTFPSSLGEIDRPFARPGDTVTLRRDQPVFSAASENRVRVQFAPLEAPAAVVDLGSIAGTACPAGDVCQGQLCPCLRFVFPDTDPALGSATDGHGRTGPARILVETGAQRTAEIDRFRLSMSEFHDDLFPGFVALPPANRFDELAGGGDVLAARDEPGNLFIPFDFSALVPDDARRTRFLDALVPNTSDDAITVVDVFTPEGQRLPPLIRQVSGGGLVGTADSPESVLRIRKGALRPGLGPEGSMGPIVIARVSVSADPLARADPLTMVVGRRFAVFEDRECGPLDEGLRCIDLNGDGDHDDYFLRALDLQTPGAQPMLIDTMDAGDFAGYPDRFPAFSLYSFSASDHVVAFRIIEIVGQGSERAVDINGNNLVGELIRSGAFDLVRGVPIDDAASSPRQEVAGPLLAYSVASDCDELRYYDAAADDPVAIPVADGAHDGFCVSRFPVGQLALPAVFPQMSFAPRTFPFDFAVNGREIAFVVPEDEQGEDLTGDGDQEDHALVVFDSSTGEVEVTGRAVAKQIEAGRAQLAMSARWVVFQCSQPRPPLPPVASVCLLDLEAPMQVPTLLCAAHGSGFVVPSLSDTLVPCVENEGGRVDLNDDGDFIDRYVLHVATPGPSGLLHESDLRLALLSSLDPQVRGGVLAVGIGEGVQGRDLDGDGVTGGSGAGPFVLHVVRQDARVTDLRHTVAASAEPFVQFIDRGLALLGPPPGFLRTIYRDVDEDGAFEEAIAGTGRLDDNCPTVANPDQRQSGDENIGDACLCPLLSVETVQAYAGSRVRVPIDLDPGRWPVGALGFRADYGLLDFDTCNEGPVAQAAKASATCTELPAGGTAHVAVLNAETTPVPAIFPGEVAGLEFRVAKEAQGQTLSVCIRQESVRIGATTGEDVCAGQITCGEVRVHPDCAVQGDCNCDGQVNGGDRVCLIAKYFNPSLRGTCPCEDCNLSGEANAADAPCITLCSFGLCATGRVERTGKGAGGS